MRKLFILGLTLSLPSLTATGQTALKIGDSLPDFTLNQVVNSKTGTFSPAEARDKVLVLEFWSTTCSPCVPAMQRLAALQQRYPNELQVVGISYDSEARLRKFLVQRPLPVLLASAADPQQAINQLFPHQSLSHTVVVDKNRRVVAITSPEELTEPVLRAVLADQPIRLKVKQDLIINNPMSLFVVDSTTRYSVNVRPYIQGLSGQTRRDRKGPFARRRLTAINQDPVSLFQEAYEVSRFRMQNQQPDSLRQYDDLNLLCFDLIVPPGQEANLHAIMREALRQYLPVQTTWVPITKPVLVLRRQKAGATLPPSARATLQTSGFGKFAMEGSPLTPLRNYLENELRQPVEDETGLTGRYDMAFTEEPESIRPSLDTALARFGLELVEAPREIKLLRLTPVSGSK